MSNQAQAELFARLQAAGFNPYAQGVSQADAELYAQLKAAVSNTNGQLYKNQTLAEEFAALASAAPLFLDKLSAVPALCFSLRQGTATYSGKCINVRRSSDNATQDIGFVGGVLDTTSLLAFVGSGSGYIATWYNQGTLGSSGNLTQATQGFQPRIVNSGTVETKNGLPTLNLGYTGTCFLNWPSAATPSGTNAFAINFVGTYQVNALDVAFLTFGTNPYEGLDFGGNTGVLEIWDGTSGSVATSFTPTAGSPFIVTAVFNGSTAYAAANGTQVWSQGSVQSLSQGAFRLGQNISSSYWAGSVFEVVVPLALLSNSDRVTLEHNQETYYGISGV